MPVDDDRPTIFVVDDDAMHCLTLSRVLHQQGYTVTLAENGRQAIEMIIADRLVEQEAEAAGITADELMKQEVQDKARQIAEERMLDLLLPKSGAQASARNEEPKEVQFEVVTSVGDETTSTREKLRSMLRKGKLDKGSSGKPPVTIIVGQDDRVQQVEFTAVESQP